MNLRHFFCFSEKRTLKDASINQSAKRRKICDNYRAEEFKTNVEVVDSCSSDRKEERKADDRNHSKQRTNDAENSNENDDTNKATGQKSNQIAKMAFQIDDIVWVKIRGFPTWPARVERFYYGRVLMVDVYWLNDYRRTKVFGSQLQNFHSHFQTYKHTFQDHVGLETAVKEALIHLMSKNKPKVL